MTSDSPSGQEEAKPNEVPAQEPFCAPAPPPTAAKTEPEPAFLGLRYGDQVALTIIAGVCLLILGVYYWRLNSHGIETITIDRPPDRILEFQVDINHSTWVEWMQLEGIGETLARRIIEDREQNGPFKSIHDVDRVKGIGKVTLERILPHLKCTGCDQTTTNL